jgi:PhnB protein
MTSIKRKNPMFHSDWFNNVELRPHPWPGLSWLTANLYYDDVAAAVYFYETVFHFVPIFEFRDKNSSNCVFARMRYRGANFVLSNKEFFAEGVDSSAASAKLSMYVYVDEVQPLYEHALKAGAVSILPPQKEFWGDIRARIKDPFGYIWDLATYCAE